MIENEEFTNTGDMEEYGVVEECYGKKALAISRHINYLYEVNHNTVSNMEEQIYDFIIPLKNCGPFVEIIKNYIGLSHPNLDAEMKLLERDPERKFRLREHVPFEKVQALIGESFPSLENDEKEFLSNLLCLVANLYYGDSYRDQQYFMLTEWNSEYNEWLCIERDLARLYSFIQDHPREEKITICMGKDKVQLDDPSNWFQAVMRNQAFTNCIPHIHNKEEAKKLFSKQAGRPESRTEVNAIVNGIARYLSDEKVIEGKAPGNLLKFIREFLVMMALIEENDVFVTKDWIKSQISNFQKSGKDPRFENVTWVSAPAEHLSARPWEKAMRWIFPIK